MNRIRFFWIFEAFLIFIAFTFPIVLWSQEPVTVVFVGDVMMGHRMIDVLEEKGKDYPFQHVQPLLDEGDMVFGNLENPVSLQGEALPEKDYTFRMSPANLPAMKKAGFRVMSLANNHILDFGPQALMDTMSYLKKHGMASCGAGKNLSESRQPAEVSVHGQSVKFLAYSLTFPVSFSATPEKPGTTFGHENFMRKDVGLAKSSHSFVAVSVHWGREYETDLAPYQQPWAHAAIEAGADIVVGHHPHIPQGIEWYQDRPIVYSLGNFVFGTGNEKADIGLLVKATFEQNKNPCLEIIPLKVNNMEINFQPQPLKSIERLEAFARLNRLSGALGTSLRAQGDRLHLP